MQVGYDRKISIRGKRSEKGTVQKIFIEDSGKFPLAC